MASGSFTLYPIYPSDYLALLLPYTEMLKD